MKNEEASQEHQKAAIRSELVKNPILTSIDELNYPTSLDILSQGVVDLRDFRKEFPWLALNASILDDVFLGISPEVGSVTGSFVDSLNSYDRQKVVSFLEKRGYAVIDLSKIYDASRSSAGLLSTIIRAIRKKEYHHSIVNLRAVWRVIEQTRKQAVDIFPASIADYKQLGEWLRADPQQWMIGAHQAPLKNERLGLMSGYPIASVLEFKQFQQARRTLYTELINLGIDREKVDTILDIYNPDRSSMAEEILRHPQFPSKMKEDFELILRARPGPDFLATSQADSDWREGLLHLKTLVSETLTKK